METLLAFDYGQKRIGVAISRENMALRLPYIHNKYGVIEKVRELVAKNNITKIIIGIALNDNDTDSRQSMYIRKFIDSINEQIRLPVIMIEESLTTRIALENLKKIGFNKEQILQEKDSESARILLQEYLDSIS